ncbi:uncharacterized protein EV422DRAFT_508383 [Fimicolochytrium jonesii]|uniref:uncharacterized protein n=1 Tax=Fimicolochytrium jonesii TaxID=1396493 RepID=UPI0022FE426D|nr:uncharacterized protein EV422DRAFT_508383 [Fimicolochytrium jonesii]KAI8818168.1 hypothetical protein EV422DRAFT_508383 [Fimicolochytrium jonesii]
MRAERAWWEKDEDCGGWTVLRKVGERGTSAMEYLRTECEPPSVSPHPPLTNRTHIAPKPASETCHKTPSAAKMKFTAIIALTVLATLQMVAAAPAAAPAATPAKAKDMHGVRAPEGATIQGCRRYGYCWTCCHWNAAQGKQECESDCL